MADRTPRRRRMLTTTYAALLDGAEWRPLPNCPGRHVLQGPPVPTPPEDLLGGGVRVDEHRVPGAPDPVLVALVPGGGLISYRHADGRFVHTLNDEAGLARKLAQLGIARSSD